VQRSRPKTKPVKLTTPWWEKDEKDLPAALVNQVTNIQGMQGGIRNRNYRAARLYGGHGFISAGRFGSSMGGSWGVNSGGYFGSYTSPRYNLIYAMVNTVLSRLISPGLPGVRILTNGAEWDMQNRAELLEQWIDGVFYQSGTENEAIMALKDALVFGTGFVLSDTDADGRITNNRLFPECIWTEMYDGKDGKPHCVYSIDLIDRDELLAKFPNKEAAIMRQQNFSSTGYDSEKAGARVVPYYRGWHMESSEERNDGIGVVAIDGEVLEVKEWRHKKPPLSKITFDDCLTGYLGRGMAELLYPHQAALSAIQRAEYYAWSQTALPRMWINIRSKINELHMMSSRSGGIIRGVGEPPQVLNWSATHPDFVGYKQWVIQSAYEFMGVSQMSASGQKPAGLNSGAAQREYMDFQTERFSIIARKWENFWVDIADNDITIGKEMYEGTSEDDKRTIYKVLSPNSMVKRISWAQVNMDRDAFWMKALPVSSLPHSPAGRLAMVSELMQANLITRDVGLRLLKFPDLDRELELANAQQDFAEKNAWLILRRGQMPPYDSIVNLQQCVTELQKAATKAMVGGLSRDSKAITNARMWLVGAGQQLKAAAASQMPPPPPMQMNPPLAQGAKPPVSQELPFAA
jgi:hypothetical protein